MPRLKTIDRYIVRAICVPVVVSLLVVTLGLLAVNLGKLADLVVNHGARVGQVLGLIGCLLPGILEQTLPVAVLLGVLLGIGRLSGDQELIAARACGVSLYRLAVPVVLFATALLPLALGLTLGWTPHANARIRGRILQLTHSSGTWMFGERVFNHNFPGITLYFERLEQPGSRLLNVLLADQRDPTAPAVIVAKNAALQPPRDGASLTLRMSDGWIFGAATGGRDRHLAHFETYDIAVGLTSLFAGPRRVSEIGTAELRVAPPLVPGGRNVWATTELARRWMTAAVLLPFALLGMLLGLTRVRGGRYERMIFAIALCFLYYVLLRAGEALAQAGTVDAMLAVGLPNFLFSAAAIVMLRLNAMDRINPGELVSAWLQNRIARTLARIAA